MILEGVLFLLFQHDLNQPRRGEALGPCRYCMVSQARGLLKVGMATYDQMPETKESIGQVRSVSERFAKPMISAYVNLSN